jgi:hypothetical protein
MMKKLIENDLLVFKEFQKVAVCAQNVAFCCLTKVGYGILDKPPNSRTGAKMLIFQGLGSHSPFFINFNAVRL